VVIVGAGPSGLALAIELGSRSIPCLVVERNVRAGWAPRAKTTHTRTREHLRRWGIADKLAAESPFGVDYPTNITFVTRLSGKLITRFEYGLQGSPEKDERYAEHSQWIPQYKLEAVLLEHARSLPSVTIAFGREFLSFAQDEAGVTVQVRAIWSAPTVRAARCATRSARRWRGFTASRATTTPSSARPASLTSIPRARRSCTGRSMARCRA
jgi:2-polyprenyl-6-methoxyphenol hydroxylase-like FAD-dependent oxidoreductase